MAPQVGGSRAVGGRWRGDGRRPLIVAEEVDDVGWVGSGHRAAPLLQQLLFAPPAGGGLTARALVVASGARPR